MMVSVFRDRMMDSDTHFMECAYGNASMGQRVRAALLLMGLTTGDE